MRSVESGTVTLLVLNRALQAGFALGISLCLQIVARALGCDTYKLTLGHCGANQPVKDLKTGRVYITAQNHGFAVAKDAMEGKATLTQLNANDLTVEGFGNSYPGVQCVQ